MNSDLKFYRIKQLSEMLNVSKSSIWGWLKKGKFPTPLKIGGNTTVWRSTDIESWVSNHEGVQDESK